MASTYKVLGQSNPSASTDTTLYTVPANRSAVISTLNICNLDINPSTYRVAVRPAGAAIANYHFLAYEATLPASDSISLILGITLATTDVVTVRASTSTVAFSLFGSEIG